MGRHRIPAMLAGLLFACGGSSSTDTTTVPEPVAVSPEAAAASAEPMDDTDVDEPAPGAEADELMAAEPDAAEPPDETRGERAEASVFMRLFGGSGGGPRASIGTPARWWIVVRDPGGAEQRYRTDSSQPASLSAPHVFPGGVAGWRCQLQRAAVQQNVQLNRGTRTTSRRAERTLVCEKDGQRRTATAVCGYDEDPSGRTPVVTPAELDVGDPQDPHRVTLGCDPPSP